MTVLQALDRYYGRMAERGEAEAPGFSREKISFTVVLSPDGMPVAVLDVRDHSGRKPRPALMAVPAAFKRTAGIKPNLLWDKTSYLFGRTAAAGLRAAEEHAAFCKAHLDLLANETDAGLVALRRFLEIWQPNRFDADPFQLEMLDSNMVFQLDGDLRRLHERPAAQALLMRQAGGGRATSLCLITGLQAPIARLHPSIKGVDGAQSSGASLVSFNLDAFSSYGKSQGDNAPTSEAAAFRYGTALNRLLERGPGGNRLRIGDATVAFWADTSDAVDEAAARLAEDFFGEASGAADQPGTEDRQEAAKLRDALTLVAQGRPVAELGLGLVPGTHFHLLGLAPNAARLSVRFWLEDRLDVFVARLARHYADLAIEPSPWNPAKPPSIQWLLVRSTALLEKFDNIPPLLAGEVTRAVLGGGRYPRMLLAAAITRLRAGDDPRRGWHASVIKAVLNRSEQEKLPVALDPESPNVAYQLGRLFAVLEQAQYAALGKVNASIADRYYAAASATPARVFAPLLRGLRNHTADAHRRGQGGWIDSKVGQIMLQLPPDLPRTLRLEDQGRFAVGYYHERATRAPKAADVHADETQNTEIAQ